MKPRLVVVFLLIVLAPLGLLLHLGVRMARDQERQSRERLREALGGQLATLDRNVSELVAARERLLQEMTDRPPAEAAAWWRENRRNPYVRQLFVLDARGRLAYPTAETAATNEERDFVERIGELIEAGALAPVPGEDAQSIVPVAPNQPARSSKRAIPQQPQAMQQAARPSQQERMPQQQSAPARLSSYFARAQQAGRQQVATSASPFGWRPWFRGEGLQLLFLRRASDGSVVGAELDRVRLLADIIGLLPDTSDSGPDAIAGRIVLTDGLGRTVYQWGAWEPPDDAAPFVERPLSEPLRAWRFRYFLPPERLNGASGFGLYFNLIGGLSAAALALIGMAIYFYRESSREIRTAAQRVTFVNQVSHELKTPLTNIRMYAELLRDRIDEEDEKTVDQLDIVISETQRLSRLIGNVLSFGRNQRRELKLRRSVGVVDDVVRRTLDHFRPAFARHDIEVSTDLRAAGEVLLDPDALEQMLGNLLSNVEKYAADGGWVGVETRREDETTRVVVRDRGPGVPRSLRARIFDPFYRVSNKLNEGVSGTGIGLAIAREIARLHGGDVTLLSSNRGAAFEIRLQTPPSEGEAS